jgi:hypothetical protein
MDLPAMLAQMDAALADEIAKVQRHDRSGKVAHQGQLVSELGGHYIYSYALDEPWEPEDDTPLSVKFAGGPRLQATVVTASGTSLTIATEVELPPEALAQVTLLDDPVQLLERLRETLKSNKESASQLGSKTFDLLPFTSTRRRELETYPDFMPRPSQVDALRLALGSEVAYVIGPPGTGKTSTLAAIAYTLVREGRSVLIAAHTNIAIDNAIVKLADMCHKAGIPALHEGRILRYGTPQLQSVRQRADVYPPKIVKRLGQDFERQRSELRTRHADVLGRLRPLAEQEEQRASQWRMLRESLVEQRKGFAGELLEMQRDEQQRVSAVDAALQQTAQRVGQAERRLEVARQELTQLVVQQARIQQAHAAHLGMLADFTARLTAVQRMSGLGRLLKGINLGRLTRSVADSKQQVWDDERALAEVQRRMELAHESVAARQQEVAGERAQYEQLKAQRQTPPDIAGRITYLQSELAHRDQQIAEGERMREQQSAACASEREALQSAVEQLSQQLAGVDEQLHDLERRLLDDAQVVATTLSKVYMDSHLRERYFDAVILDEVSMAPLPAVYIAASRAEGHVVAIGDPLQLAPIVRAETAAAKKWLGRDLFAVADITLERASTGDRRSVLLREQARMHPTISAIARKHVYSGRVVDAQRPANDDYGRVSPLPGHPLLLCDTSDGAPVTSRPGGSSRINLYHALCAVTIGRQMLGSLPDRSADPGNPFRVGIATPYRAQAQLIQRMVKAEGLEHSIRVGTIHRFQGLEFEAIVLDTVESPPIPHRRDFIGGGAGSGGQRLINVAVTRPQHKLVIIANTKHIADRFEADDMLRLAVNEAQQGGVIASRALLSEIAGDPLSHRPPSTMAGQGPVVMPPIEWLDDTTFFDRFLADVRSARSSIIICSPFVRQGRTSSVASELEARCAAGLRVTVVASQSSDGSAPVDGPAKDMLERAGVEFRTSPGMHEKVVLIDDNIVYFGSLNPLSHNATTELMQRIESSILAGQVARLIRITERTAPASWGEDFVLSIRDLPAGGSCPICGRPLRARTGRYGAFYSCSGYSRGCQQTRDIIDGDLVTIPALARIECDQCKAGVMRPRVQRRNMWLECAAPHPCDRRRKLIIE